MSTLARHRKLAAAVAGLCAMIASRYGLELHDDAAFAVEAIIAILTAAGVYQFPNARS